MDIQKLGLHTLYLANQKFCFVLVDPVLIRYLPSASTLQFSHFLLRTMQMLPNFTKDYFLVIDDFVPFVLALFESRTNDCIFFT